MKPAKWIIVFGAAAVSPFALEILSGVGASRAINLAIFGATGGGIGFPALTTYRRSRQK
jgi:hypothetical protein